MADAAYEAAVKTTFETKPLRTVLLVDDEFPTFSDLVRGERPGDRNFAQKDRAFGLYEGFRKRRMICDVENQVADLEIDRFRKSDLIILDYHLSTGSHDTETSIRLLRRLASSKHFNTVIVYTAQVDLNEAWLDLVATLSGGWTDPSAQLEGDARVHWERLNDENRLPGVSRNALMQFARRRSLRDLELEHRNAVQEELASVGVPAGICGELITAMMNREMRCRAGEYGKEPHLPTVGDYREEVRWIQTHNSFVCIVQKEADSFAEDKAERLMAFLGRALQAWRPNLFQVLVSEIQNILELEALCTADELLRDPTTHTALWYYLLETAGRVDPLSNPDVKAPLLSIVDKVVDGIRRRLTADEELLSVATDVFLGELRDTGWTDETWPRAGQIEMGKAAMRLARTEGTTTMSDVFFRLNSFVCTEAFTRAHLTTGTICFHPPADEYFVIASPACDLEAREPACGQKWARAIHPLTPVVAIRLHTIEGVEAALGKATRGQHIFLERGNDKKVFKVVNDVGQPSYEFFFAADEGRVREVEGRVVVEVGRVMTGAKSAAPATEAAEVEEGAGRWVETTFEIVGQLRDMNATRLLQMAGQHLSRVGLDFLDKPSR